MFQKGPVPSLTNTKQSETAVLRQVLKYLRQRRLLTAYRDVVTRSGLHLEHTLVTQLHETLVLRGDFQGSEALLGTMANQGLFDDYLRKLHQPTPVWNRILGTDADGDRPSARGGHAMCIDQNSRTIFLLGGWDGRNLDDFWAYDIDADRWRVLSHSTAADNGPSPRSCHKMVFDPRTGKVYVLGSLDAPSRDGDSSQGHFSDFYCYNTSSAKWDYLAHDTGVRLILPHCMDSTQLLRL